AATIDFPTIDFPQQIQDRILESQLVDDLKIKLSGTQKENDKRKRVSIRSSQLLKNEKLLEYDGSKSLFFQVRGSIPREQIDDLSYKSRLSIFEHEDTVWMLIMKCIDHPLNDMTSSDTKISHLPTSLVDKALTIGRTYDVTDALDSPERPGPMDWQNLMSGQPATSTWNSLDEQRCLTTTYMEVIYADVPVQATTVLPSLDEASNRLRRLITKGISISLLEFPTLWPTNPWGHNE
ncbi:hypothetical protein Tco_0846133, partial [Tanacetum coccineum]